MSWKSCFFLHDNNSVVVCFFVDVLCTYQAANSDTAEWPNQKMLLAASAVNQSEGNRGSRRDSREPASLQD